MSTTYTTPKPQPSTTQSPCRCHEQPPQTCTCCGLECFERPNYFCGHLLTDADLSLEQKYVREKNKLYHRAIDGYGIACGLKITCDPQCKGQILVHKGFAIDDCGNDLVVCETTRFDVIGALRDKGMLVIDEPDDRCEPKKKGRRCKIKQCFYVTICYEETQSNYETPFQSGCSAGVKECLPTRTQERSRFDVVDKLPEHPNYLTQLENRFKHCFEIACEGEIGRIMEQYIGPLRTIVQGKLGRENNKDLDPCQIFCTLRAWFINHLKSHPDEFNCGLTEEVQCLLCPDEYTGQDPAGWSEYSGNVQDAFRRLITLIQRYQFDCAMGELIVSCQEPCEAHCIVLGTVEIEDGKLVRLCNTPRTYLWSAANFLPVLFYYLLNERESHLQKQGEEHGSSGCCPSYPDFVPETFLDEFSIDKCGRYYAAATPIYAVRSLVSSLRRGFAITDSAAHAPRLFEKALRKSEAKGGTERAKAAALSDLNVQITDLPASEFRHLNFSQAVMANTLLRPGDALVHYINAAAGINRVLPDYVAEVSPDQETGRKLASAPDLKGQFEQLQKTVQQQQASIDELNKRLANFKPAAEAKRRSTRSGIPPADDKKPE
jgi:hypothetical protein